MLEALLRGRLRLAPVERLRHDDPHAGEPLRDRDQPDPPHVRARQHADVARRAGGGPPPPPLVTRSELGISQTPPASARVSARMSPAGRPEARGMPSYWACT